MGNRLYTPGNQPNPTEQSSAAENPSLRDVTYAAEVTPILSAGETEKRYNGGQLRGSKAVIGGTERIVHPPVLEPDVVVRNHCQVYRTYRRPKTPVTNLKRRLVEPGEATTDYITM